MSLEEIYLLTTELIDSNSKKQVDLDRGRFVILFNRAQLRYFRQVLTQLGNINIQLIQQFLVPVELSKVSENKLSESFKLPKDLILKDDITVFGTKGECTDLIDVEEIKPSDINFKLTDANTEPKFEYREALYTVSNDCINIFTKGDFKVSTVTLNYYREPKPIDIEGYQHTDDKYSKNVEPEWKTDDQIQDIIDLIVRDFSIAELPLKSSES